MKFLWALRGEHSGEVLSYGGRVVAHTDRAEMEWLFPHCRVVQCPADLAATALPLAAHPDMAAVRFPLTKEQFR